MTIFTLLRLSIYALVLSCFSIGCSNQYDNTKPNTNPSSYARTLARAKKDNRYLIMHSGTDIYKITFLEVEKSRKQFTVQLNRVDSLHAANMNNQASPGEKLIHVYLRDTTTFTLDEPHTIPLAKVARIGLAQ